MPHLEEESYVLSRGYAASSRLNLQAFLWKSLFKTDTGLHPIVDGICCQPKSPLDKQAILFADVATGTGVLLMEMSNHVSDNTQLHGFDVSPDQFPHASFLPPNVKFFVSDAIKEPTEALRGRYDVVHVRMMNAAIDNNDPGPVLNHASLLLKEHGILQWDELDAWQLERGPRLSSEASTNERQASDTLETPCLDGIVNIFRHTKETMWISNLSKYFTTHHFNVIFDEQLSLEPWKRHMLMEIWCLVTDEFANTLAAKGQMEQAMKVRKLVQGAHGEIRQGAYFEHQIRVVVGRKLPSVA